MAIVDETFTNFSRLSSLLSTESALINGVATALNRIEQFLSATGGDPSKMDPAQAIVALSNAGAALTSTFNAGLSSINGGILCGPSVQCPSSKRRTFWQPRRLTP
jgi:hypothetical protein